MASAKISPNQSLLSRNQLALASQYNSYSSNNDKEQIIISHYAYKESDFIGKGQFSLVYRGKDLNNGQQVAVKVIDVTKVKEAVFLKMLQNEIEILRMVDNKNIVKLYEEQTINNLRFFILEYCDQGDLQKFIKARGKLSQDESINILKHLMLGLIECQTKFIIHRDIKPANILFSQGIPKIADFGFGVQRDLPTSNELGNYNVGSPLYMAPESLINNTYSFKSDVWALGIVLYEMLIGHTPFISPSEDGLRNMLREYQMTCNLNIPQDILIDSHVINLLHCMLSYESSKRHSIRDLFQHPAITNSIQKISSSTQQSVISNKQQNKNDDIPDDPSIQEIRVLEQTFMEKKQLEQIEFQKNQNLRQFIIQLYDLLNSEGNQSLVNVRLENTRLRYCIAQILIPIAQDQGVKMLMSVRESQDFQKVILLKEPNFECILKQPNRQQFFDCFNNLVLQKIHNLFRKINLSIDTNTFKDQNPSTTKKQILLLSHLIKLMQGIKNQENFANINLNFFSLSQNITQQFWENLVQETHNLKIY